ncbi:MAG TPA: prephenate dehydratase domain-containing protein [Terriglobia bacterium]|nr:prephenate dehydratase domain-containing protein [Terriglobia bacterium]
MTKITAIQGEDGSNSAAAARSLLGDDVALLYCDSFQDAFNALENGIASRAVLPIENTTAGIIQPVWDRLLGITPGRKLVARSEARVRIGFVAAALPGSRNKVKTILAHEVANRQCRRFLQESGWTVVTCHDTAGAARLVREGNDETVAALCPLPAARVHQLEILNPDCGDSSRTWTRFLLIEHGEATPTAADDRSILIFALQDIPGALVKTLHAFSSQGLNLSAIHSRAVPGFPGQYRFFVELNVGARDPRSIAAMREVTSSTSEVQLLGSYTTPPWPEEMPTR